MDGQRLQEYSKALPRSRSPKEKLMFRILTLAFALTLMIACGDSATNTATKAEKTPEPTATKTPIPTRQGEQFPSIPGEMMERLGSSCDHLDYTFLQLPISMSADEQAAKGSVMSFLRHISTTPAIVLAEGCPYIAKVDYHIKGEIVLMADFHYNENKQECNYLVFYEDGKRKYANYITPEGMGYYKQIFDSLKGQKQQ